MSKRQPISPRKKIVLRKPTLDFSITGLIYCTTMMFIGLAAINTQANLLFGVFGLMIGILLASFWVSGIVIRRLRTERILPDHGIVGRPMSLQYRVTNEKRFWPSFAVTVAEIDGYDLFTRQSRAYLLHAPNKGSAVVPSEVIPIRRGVFELDRFQLSTSFPFGFIKRALDRRVRDSILVLPAIGSMRRDLMRRFKSAESSGINVRPSSGGTDEFYGVKEYRSGENPRWIYWKRSAGSGPMVVREMTRVSPPRLLLLVDTFARDDARETHIAIERAIAMAATVIDHAMAEGLPIGLIAWSGDWITILPNRGKRHRLDLLTALAKLTPNRQIEHDALVEKSRAMLKSDTTSVLFTPYHLSMGFGQVARGSVIVLSSASGERDPLFKFPPLVDFSLGHGDET
ncbi:MAG: DUF58 domain-containing protein [Tepidisphaeraceae bacterium]